MFGNYMIKFNYYQEGKRIKETDTFWADSAQEAVDMCRAEYHTEFSDHFGRIECVYREGFNSWDVVESWD